MNLFPSFPAQVAPEPSDIERNAWPQPTKMYVESLEAALRTLDSPDYRILQRFQPQKAYGLPGRITDPDLAVGVIVDTETTGLDPIYDEIIELAAVKFAYEKTGHVSHVIEARSWLRMPTKPIPEHIVALTGITDGMVAGKVLPDDEINAFFAGATVLVAHNAAFDRPMLEPLYKWAVEKHWACTMAEIDWKAQGAPSQALQVIAWTLGFFFDGHRGGIDCQALLHILAQPRPEGEGTFLAELLASARQPTYRVWAVGAPFEFKDTLKARGYQWNPGIKTWFRDLRSQEAVAEETAWLEEHKMPRPSVKAFSSLHRYSNRENKQ